MFSWLNPLHLWRHHFTAAGKTLTLATLFCVPGLISLDTPLLQLLSIIVPTLLISVVVGLQNRPKLRLTGSMSRRVMNGREFEVLFTLTNLKFRTTYNIDLDLDSNDEFEVLSELPTLSWLAGKSSISTTSSTTTSAPGSFRTTKTRGQ